MSNSPESFDSLWAYCTANWRLVPKPAHWSQFYTMLKNTRQKLSGGWEPPLPLILAAWDHSLPIEKQFRFKEHVQWAHDQGQLVAACVFLRSLPEDDWHHFGES